MGYVSSLSPVSPPELAGQVQATNKTGCRAWIWVVMGRHRAPGATGSKALTSGTCGRGLTARRLSGHFLRGQKCFVS